MSLSYNKRLYSIKEYYRFLYEAFRSMPDLKKAKKQNQLDEKLQEKIMLAVTEVNGCRVCSYYHSSAALKSGMSEDEIANLLSGSIEDVSEDESIALIFAQHYADSHGIPDIEAWKRLVTTYGKTKSMGILGAIRMIMIGNTSGIAYGAFKERLKGNAVKDSHIFYEIGLLLSTVIFLPVALIHGLIAKLAHAPLIKFNK